MKIHRTGNVDKAEIMERAPLGLWMSSLRPFPTPWTGNKPRARTTVRVPAIELWKESPLGSGKFWKTELNTIKTVRTKIKKSVKGQKNRSYTYTNRVGQSKRRVAGVPTEFSKPSRRNTYVPTALAALTLTVRAKPMFICVRWRCVGIEHASSQHKVKCVDHKAMIEQAAALQSASAPLDIFCNKIWTTEVGSGLWLRFRLHIFRFLREPKLELLHIPRRVYSIYFLLLFTFSWSPLDRFRGVIELLELPNKFAAFVKERNVLRMKEKSYSSLFPENLW